MSEAASGSRLVAEALGKHYRVYRRRSGRLLEWLTRGRVVAHESRWALRDVSFAVRPGESLGIVGMNGAGKSTLLRILTGTTRPSEGHFAVHGRVAALLELGLGFHPEFSGWRNAGFACQLLGLEDDVIRGVLPWIQEFSELGDALEQPVRTYSTGMQVRLAFSVATAVRPDVLIVDEALSVGDAYFQHKSMTRIRAFRDQGTTLLLVSHDPAAVKALCDRALLLEGGRLIQDSTPDAVLDWYNASIARRESDAAIVQGRGPHGVATRSGTREAEILTIQVCDDAGRECRAFPSGARARVRVRLRLGAAMEVPTVGILLRDRLGGEVFGTNTQMLGASPAHGDAGSEHLVEFALGLALGVGAYALSVALHAGHTHVARNFDWWDRAAVVEVVAAGSPAFVGVAALPVTVATMETTHPRPDQGASRRERS